MKIPEFKIRTDLALEEREGLKEAAEKFQGFLLKSGKENGQQPRSQK